MINEANQDAEESRAIEKTAIEQTEPTTATAEAVAPETPETETPETQENAAAASLQEPPAVESQQVPETVEAVPEIADAPAATAAEAEPVAEPAVETALPERKPNRVVMAPKVPFAVPPPAPEPSTSIPAAVAPVEEPMTSDIDFGAILEQFEQEQTVFHQGDLVEGKVVGITDRGVLVDFGYKSEGFVPVEEFTGPGGEMTAVVGDPVEVIIRTMHAGDSAPQLSRIDALGRKVWDDIEAAFNSETPITGRVVDKTKGGLRIDLNGVEAFLPGSQIDSRPIRGLDSYIGQEIETQVIKFSRRRNNIVLSRKVITDKVVNVQKAETLARIEIGYVVDGTVKNITEYGAFVDIGGIDGLLHVTDMSWGRIHHPSDQFKVGEHIQVKVLKLDREREKVSLGYKQLLPDPWSTVVEVYPVNTKITGVVSSVTEYGVFVELEPGVEGLVHVSEISWSRRAQSPKRMFHKGQKVEVQVLGVDTVEKRISLGMKQFADNPWDTVDIKYPVGTKIIGRVRNLTEFGAFIELEEGIDGLVHVSDITWAKKIKHPKDVLKRDQEVEAVVTSIDKRGQRLSLSMKDLTPSAWEGFVATHRPGDTVRGKVSRFTNFGVFVELGEGLEGLCHISELSDERVDRAESVAELGQEMDFKILRIEPAEQKIGLSHRAVGKAGEPVVDTKIYSSEAKGGMASLGELAKLRFGDAAEAAPAQEDPDKKKKAKQAAKKAKAEEFAAKEAEAAIEAETSMKRGSTAEAASESAAVDETPASETGGEAAVEDVAAETPTTETAEAAEDVSVETPAAETEEQAPVVATSDEAQASESVEEATSQTSETDTVPEGETTGQTESAQHEAGANESSPAEVAVEEIPKASEEGEALAETEAHAESEKGPEAEDRSEPAAGENADDAIAADDGSEPFAETGESKMEVTGESVSDEAVGTESETKSA